MDTQATWELLLVAWTREEWEEVIELASNLLDWLNKEGFAPETCSSHQVGHDWNVVVTRAACTFARQRACSVLSDPGGIPENVPFSLTCDTCGNDGPDSQAEALTEGWTELRYAPTLVSANFVGLCPDCLESEQVSSR